MRNTLATAILLFSTIIFAQQKTERAEIYHYINGIKDIVPTQIIETDRFGKQYIYNITNGIQDGIPTQIIEKQNGKQIIYDVKDGVQELFPRLEVRTEIGVPFIDNFVPNPFN